MRISNGKAPTSDQPERLEKATNNDRLSIDRKRTRSRWLWYLRFGKAFHVIFATISAMLAATGP
jgi:hypothetical protein